MTAEEFRAWRRRHCWTQIMAARMLDVHRDSVINWEHGRTPINHVVYLATKAIDAEMGMPL